MRVGQNFLSTFWLSNDKSCHKTTDYLKVIAEGSLAREQELSSSSGFDTTNSVLGFFINYMGN